MPLSDAFLKRTKMGRKKQESLSQLRTTIKWNYKTAIQLIGQKLLTVTGKASKKAGCTLNEFVNRAVQNEVKRANEMTNYEVEMSFQMNRQQILLREQQRISKELENCAKCIKLMLQKAGIDPHSIEGEKRLQQIEMMSRVI